MLRSTWSLKTCGAFASEKARTCCHLGPQVPIPLSPSHSPGASEAPPSRRYHPSQQSRLRTTAECGTKSVISLSLGIVISFRCVRMFHGQDTILYTTWCFNNAKKKKTPNPNRNRNNNYSTLNGQQVFKVLNVSSIILIVAHSQRFRCGFPSGYR